MYSESMTAGTCIKLWNYKFPGRLKTLATLDLRYALERSLPDPGLPIRVRERRDGYRAHYYDTTMSGILPALADSPEKIEPGFDTGTPLKIPNVGEVHLRLLLMREDVERERFQSGVFFSVNGQLHSEFGSDFVSRRTKLDYIADSLLVFVDCTELPALIREDLFLASRDRMRFCEERTALEDSIVDYLREHEGLKDINARRRQSRLSSTGQEQTQQVLQLLVRDDPTLANLFGVGKKIRIPTGPLPEPEPYSGRQFPTYFRIHKEPKEGLIRKCPKNRNARVEFETDAENNYFSRPQDPGRYEGIGVPSIKSVHLWNGKASLRISLPQTCNVGDKFSIQFSVSDISRAESMNSNFVIEVADEVQPGEPHISEPSRSGLVGIPNITEVWKSDWAKHGFDERSGLKFCHGEDDTLDVMVNMDNINLRNEISRRRTKDPQVLRYWFKYGLFLLAMGMLHYHRSSEAKTEPAEDGSDFAMISEASKGLAVTVIPVIYQLHKDKSD